ncbi:MAG: cbb3-type cytochrome oxidase assembly protein CcoS [Rhodoplanes sp.]
MEVLIYLVPMALGLGLLGLVAFIWALNSGQFDDLDGTAWRAIMDDDQPARAAPAQEGNSTAEPARDGRDQTS